jgi:NarL family two-component system response regulator LiaR
MSQPDRIRVVIVDDHPVVRSALSALLLAYEDLELIGEAANGREAVELCDRLQPDVVLMDLVMPVMDGPTATYAIRSHCPGTRVVALTSFDEMGLVQEALRAGVSGYLLKTGSGEALISSIRAAVAGQPVASADIERMLAPATSTAETF